MSDRRTWRALHPHTRGVPAPAQDLGHSRSRIVIEPASVPEAAAKPALRHAGLYGAGLVALIPFLGNAPRACEVLGQDCFPPFGWRRQDQKDKAPRCRSKDGGGHECRVYRGEPADLRKEADDRSEGLRPPLRAGRRPSLAGSLSGRKGVPKRGSFSRERHSAEHVD